MKKKFLFLIGTCLYGVMAHADSYPYFTFQKSDGSTVTMESTSLTMTFSDGKLIASNGTDSQELTVSDLLKMYFSEDGATGIQNVDVSDADGEVEVFSLQGVSYGTFGTLQSFKNSAEPGVYIVKVNGRSQKIMVR